MKHAHLLSILTVAVAGPLLALADTPPLETTNTPDVCNTARLSAVEAQLTLIQRKLSLLASSDEDALLDIDAVFASPEKLFAHAQAAMDAHKLEEAYATLMLIHTLHPDSEYDEQAFPKAVGIFKHNYFHTRYTDPQSHWLLAEPYTLFQWLYTLRDKADSSSYVVTLLSGMPYSFFSDYQAYAKRYYRNNKWTVAVQKDDGVIESVNVTVTPE